MDQKGTGTWQHLVKDAALKARSPQGLPVKPCYGGHADMRQRQAVFGLHMAGALVSRHAFHQHRSHYVLMYTS